MDGQMIGLKQCSSLALNVPVLFFKHSCRQSYLMTNNVNWPSHWLPAMETHTGTLLPYPDSGYSTKFAAYIQFLREHHLVFLEPTLSLAYVNAEEDNIQPKSIEGSFCETELRYDFLALRIPTHNFSQLEYRAPPGFALLDGMLYSASSLEVVEL
jgi:hypothetical protein